MEWHPQQHELKKTLVNRKHWLWKRTEEGKMKEKSAKLLRSGNRGWTFPNKFWNKTVLSVKMMVKRLIVYYWGIRYLKEQTLVPVTNLSSVIRWSRKYVIQSNHNMLNIEPWFCRTYLIYLHTLILQSSSVLEIVIIAKWWVCLYRHTHTCAPTSTTVNAF